MTKVSLKTLICLLTLTACGKSTVKGHLRSQVRDVAIAGRINAKSITNQDGCFDIAKLRGELNKEAAIDKNIRLTTFDFNIGTLDANSTFSPAEETPQTLAIRASSLLSKGGDGLEIDTYQRAEAESIKTKSGFEPFADVKQTGCAEKRTPITRRSSRVVVDPKTKARTTVEDQRVSKGVEQGFVYIGETRYTIVASNARYVRFANDRKTVAFQYTVDLNHSSLTVDIFQQLSKNICGQEKSGIAKKSYLISWDTGEIRVPVSFAKLLGTYNISLGKRMQDLKSVKKTGNSAIKVADVDFLQAKKYVEKQQASADSELMKLIEESCRPTKQP